MGEEARKTEDTEGGGPAVGDPAAEVDVTSLQAKLREEQEKAQSHLSSWQRAAADYQNLKRRIEEERSEVGRLANAALVINLLPLVDDLERALRNVDSNIAGLTWIDGIWLIYRKFQAVLENAGVKEIPADGQAFDPSVHEAISEAPGEDGKIVSVVQRGYMLGDRVIRPAMVVVGRGQGPGATGQGDGTQGAGNETREGDTRTDVSG